MELALLRALVVLVVATAAAAGDWPGFPRKRDSTANMNDYMDNVLTQAVEFMYDNEMEPYAIQDQYVYNTSFKFGFTWHTRLGLYNGEARNLTTLHRVGDSQLSYTSDSRSLQINTTVAFTPLVVCYHYAAETLNMGPRGTVTAYIKSINAGLTILMNLRSLNVTLQNFALESPKSIKMDITGLTLLGNLVAEGFTNFILLILKDCILKVIEDNVATALQSSINSTNAGSLGFSVR